MALPKSPPVPDTVQDKQQELLESVHDQFTDLYDVSKKLIDKVEDSTSAIRMEMQRNEREMVETRAHLTRLQNRLDNQLMTLILANLASGVGVAAVMMAATQAF